MSKKWIALLLCFFLIAISIQAYATTSSTKKSQDNLDSTNKKIDNLQESQKAVESEISTNESKLESVMSSISALEVDIETQEDEIGQAQADLAAAQLTQDSQYQAMKLRIQYMYENSSSFSYTTMLMESKNFAEMLNKIEYISNVYTYDRNILSEYKETTQDIADLKDDLEEEMASLQDMQASYSEQKDTLNATVASLQAQSADYEKQIANAKAAAAKYQAQIIAAKASSTSTKTTNTSSTNKSATTTNTSTSSTGINPAATTNVSASAVISYAKQFLGNPYVYGGTDINNGIDCSGYVQYVFAHFGISMPRTSYEDRSVGTEVSLDSIAPGDIVCFNGHVAIYIGDNQIIHARGTAYGIMITTLDYRSDIVAVRRVL